MAWIKEFFRLPNRAVTNDVTMPHSTTKSVELYVYYNKSDVGSGRAYSLWTVNVSADRLIENPELSYYFSDFNDWFLKSDRPVLVFRSSNTEVILLRKEIVRVEYRLVNND